MKTEVQEKNNIRPLKECLEKISEKELERLYDEALALVYEKKPNKVSEQEKIEYISGNILAKYLSSLLFLKKEELKKIEDAIYRNKINKESKMLIEENYIFQVGDEYYIPEELKEVFEHVRSKDVDIGKKNMLLSSYIIANGLLKIDKLIDLIEKSGYKITKKEIMDIVKKNNYIIRNNIIYLNEIAEDFNEDNELLNMKELNEYKVITLEDAMSMFFMIDSIKGPETIANILKKKVKDKEERDTLSEIILSLISMSDEYEELVEQILEEFDIKLSEKEEEILYSTLEDIYHVMPSWSLNGYTPHEMYCDDEDNFDDEYSFDNLSDEDKKEIYILNYVMINGIINIDKVVELLSNCHNLKTNKKEVIKIVKNRNFDEENCIIDDYLCYTNFPKEDFEWILSLKKLEKYKVIEDMDNLINELEANDIKFNIICDEYNLSEETANELKSMMIFGILNEDTISTVFKNSKYTMSLKKQQSLYKELKNVIRNTRMWILNGYTPIELNNTFKTEKVGRNDKCTCGSGKKYKLCCGK